MPYQNISAELTDSVKQDILNRLQNITDLLPFLINLTLDERHSLPKMGDKSFPFVDKSLELAEQNPHLVPPYIDINELKKDFQLAQGLRTVQNATATLLEKISDTYIAAGSEALTAALTFYQSAKQAAKKNVPGTDLVVNELAKRFENMGKKKPV